MSLLRTFPGATATLGGESLVRDSEFSSLRDLPAPRWGEGARQCAIRSVMKEGCEAIVTILEKVTVAERCSRAHQLRLEPLPSLDFMN